MFELNGPVLHYALDDAGRCASFIHVPTGHETVELPGHIFKLIYSIPGTEQQECAADGKNLMCSLRLKCKFFN